LILDYDAKSNPLFIHFKHEGYKSRVLTRKIAPSEEEQDAINMTLRNNKKKME
jgi:hypothetical protein